MKNYILLFLIFLFKGTFLFSQEKIVVYQGNTVLYQTFISDIEDIRLLNHSVVFNLEDNPLKIISMTSIDSIAFVKVYPLDVDITDFSLEGGQYWQNLEADSVYQINSRDELLAHISDTETNIPAIDFDKYSLLFVHGWATNGIVKITKDLQQTSAINYVLNVDFELNDATVAPRWYIAILTSKLPQNVVVKLNKSVKVANPAGFVEIIQDNLYGFGSEGISKQDLIIKSQQEWTNLQTAINSINRYDIPETEIDFAKYIVLAVFDEVKGNGGWSIDITNISEMTDKIIVTICNLKTGNATSIMTQPFHIVKIPVSKKKIEFEHKPFNN